MRFIRWGSKMPSAKYNLVTNDDYDTRIPLHSDEAFHYGITFHAKYIGTMDVPRPTSRVEIVAAMRRIRYEFKAKGVKKKKVTVVVSIHGVKVSARKKAVAKKKEGCKLFGGSKNGSNDSGASTSGPAEPLLHHPIYRIFYVSHDSSDLKIFSYIARDGSTNLFRCNVFKSTKKSQAMRIVRTVGQAFEVCHKISNNSEPTASGSVCDDAAASVSDVASEPPKKEAVSESAWEAAEACASSSGEGGSTSGAVNAVRPQKLELLPPPPRKENRRSPQRPVTTSNTGEVADSAPDQPSASSAEGAGGSIAASTPLSAQHELQLLKERLEQQSQQTGAAVAQLILLRDQLAAEQAARCEAQARTHQLLVHNKELLDHITALVAHLQERESGSRHTTISSQQLTMVPQMAAVMSADILNSASNNINNNITLNENTDILELLAQSPVKANQQNHNNFQQSSPIGTTATTLVNGINSVDGVNVGAINGNAVKPVTGNNDGTVNINDPFNGVEQIITQFQTLTTSNNITNNQQFYQNCSDFPSISPLSNGNLDLEKLLQLNRAIVGSNGQSPQSPNSNTSYSSLLSQSSAATSKDSTPSSEDGANIIKPLSHSTTVTATDAEGRIRLIVPISPSASASDFDALKSEAEDKLSDVTLNITDEHGETKRAVLSRTTSEKVPNRSEMMEAMRMQRTRHTTKE